MPRRWPGSCERRRAFRAVVGQRVDGSDSRPTPTGDPVGAAARAYLLRLPDADDLIEPRRPARRRDACAPGSPSWSDGDAADRRSWRGAPSDDRVSGAAADHRGPSRAEVERLRQRLREQGTRLRELQDAGRQRTRRAAAAKLDRAHAPSGTRPGADAELLAAARRGGGRPGRRGRADSRSDCASRRATGGRASDRRLELLLGALEGAAAGLRREWDLIGGGPDPADVVAARLPAQPVRRGADRRPVPAARLDRRCPAPT